MYTVLKLFRPSEGNRKTDVAPGNLSSTPPLWSVHKPLALVSQQQGSTELLPLFLHQAQEL